MSLAVLVIMVAVGIASVVAAVHWTGGTVTMKIDGSENALTLFAVDYPAERPVEVWLTEDGEAAFIDLGTNGMGIVAAMGDRFLTRVAGPGDIREISRPDGLSVQFDFADFTWRGGRFVFADTAEADAVASRLASRTLA